MTISHSGLLFGATL